MTAIDNSASTAAGTKRPRRTRKLPTAAQIAWLTRGVNEPGGKLPLFDDQGQKVRRPLIDACLAAGWVERWFDNPLKPDWLVCRLTPAGRAAIQTFQTD